MSCGTGSPSNARSAKGTFRTACGAHEVVKQDAISAIGSARSNEWRSKAKRRGRICRDRHGSDGSVMASSYLDG
jgi:hypothetical protein